MTDEHKQYASTAVATLEAHILSVHSAKSEAEWWAHREIERLRAENEKLREERDTIGEANYVSGWNGAINSSEEMQDLRAENEKLRAALKPFADIAKQFEFADDSEGISGVLLGDLRAAAAALKETGDGPV